MAAPRWRACRATHGFDGAGKLQKKTVTGGIGDPTMMFGKQWFNKFGLMPALGRKGAFFVDTNQARKACNIGGHDRC
jgi:hypothetical protein